MRTSSIFATAVAVAGVGVIAFAATRPAPTQAVADHWAHVVVWGVVLLLVAFVAVAARATGVATLPAPRPAVQLIPDGPVLCPHCGGDQIAGQRQGFGWGKAIIGGLAAGPVGAGAGFIGSGTVRVSCLRCGHSWKAGSV